MGNVRASPDRNLSSSLRRSRCLFSPRRSRRRWNGGPGAEDAQALALRSRIVLACAGVDAPPIVTIAKRPRARRRVAVSGAGR